MESVPVQKWKVVFLGDMAVGKTSIINRFIFDNFTGNEQVLPSSLSLQSEWTSSLGPSPSTTTGRSGCSSGTQRVKIASTHSSPATSGTRKQPS